MFSLLSFKLLLLEIFYLGGVPAAVPYGHLVTILPTSRILDSIPPFKDGTSPRVARGGTTGGVAVQGAGDVFTAR